MVTAGGDTGPVATLAGAALAYATLGWAVFPCIPGGKAPACAHGFKDATTDPGTVAGWWARWPAANIGYPTGITYDVADFDRKPNGVDALPLVDKLNRAGLLAGCVGISETRNGGLHLWFPTAGGPSGALAREGIDFKAAGGYVLLPPSRVPSDFPDLPGAYRWRDFPPGTAPGRPLDWEAVRRYVRPHLVHHHLVAAPAPRPPRTGAQSAVGLLRRVESATVGERNAVLYWAACRARDDGLAGVEPELLAAAVRAGLPEAEARRTLASAGRGAA